MLLLSLKENWLWIGLLVASFGATALPYSVAFYSGHLPDGVTIVPLSFLALHTTEAAIFAAFCAIVSILLLGWSQEASRIYHVSEDGLFLALARIARYLGYIAAIGIFLLAAFPIQPDFLTLASDGNTIGRAFGVYGLDLSAISSPFDFFSFCFDVFSAFFTFVSHWLEYNSRFTWTTRVHQIGTLMFFVCMEAHMAMYFFVASAGQLFFGSRLTGKHFFGYLLRKLCFVAPLIALGVVTLQRGTVPMGPMKLEEREAAGAVQIFAVFCIAVYVLSFHPYSYHDQHFYAWRQKAHKS